MDTKKSKDIFGKEENFYSKSNLSKTSTDGRLISINEKYLAIAQNSPGFIKIIDSNNNKRLETNNLISTNDKSNILDIEFSPFDNNILAYSNENKSVIIMNIYEESNNIKLKNFDIFKKHNNKVNKINFNPVASNIMASGTVFREVYIWDSTKLEEIYREPPSKNSNNYTSLLWALNGKSLGISTKKGFLNFFDIRENKYYIENQIEGFSESHKINFNWIDDNIIVALGHNKKNIKERIMSLFDIRKQSQNEKIKVFSSIGIDEGQADSIPLINHELKLIYSVGKDSSNIIICDYSKSALKKLTRQIIVQESNVYSAIYPRKFLDKKNREIDRIVRSNKNNNIYYSRIKIPEKNSGFDGDLYPNEESGKPLYTNEIWKEIIEGKIKDEIINNGEEYIDKKVEINKEEKKEEKSLNNDIKTIEKKDLIETDKIKVKEEKKNDEINEKNVYKTDETKLSIQKENNKENNKNLNIQKPKINEKKEENNNKLQNNNNNELQTKKEDKLKKLLLFKSNNQPQEKTEENYNEINIKEQDKKRFELKKIFKKIKENVKQEKSIEEKIINEENKANVEKENLDLKQNLELSKNNDCQENENDLRIKKIFKEFEIKEKERKRLEEKIKNEKNNKLIKLDKNENTNEESQIKEKEQIVEKIELIFNIQN